jgi:hypothetical protein
MVIDGKHSLGLWSYPTGGPVEVLVDTVEQFTTLVAAPNGRRPHSCKAYLMICSQVLCRAAVLQSILIVRLEAYAKATWSNS